MKTETKRQRLFKILISIVSVYLVILTLVFLNQRSLLYFPHHPDSNPVPAPATVGLDMQVVHVTTDDNLNLVAWFAPPKEKGGPVVVVYHGNAANIAYRKHIARAMLDKGYGVFMGEYRGFGGNPGSPSEEGLYKDARTALKWLAGKGYKNLVYYGESLGTGVATEMAMEKTPRLLIIQSGFSNIADVASSRFWYFPVNLLLRDRYDSIAKIAKVKAPILVIHGTQDELIPIALAHKLYDAANAPKDFIATPGAGHGDLYDHGAGPVITGWIEKQLKNR